MPPRDIFGHLKFRERKKKLTLKTRKHKMAIHEEAVHVVNADVPDEHNGGHFEVPLCIFTGSEALT